MDKKSKGTPLIGEYTLQVKSFPEVEQTVKKFLDKNFQKKPDRERSESVNSELLSLIQKAPEPAFLLSEVLDYVHRIDKEDVLAHYTFTSFEIWLNQFSGLSFEENLHIRAKIVGKRVPRDSYQIMFPIGMGKVYEGTHFVTAHKSPDLDTTVASFWGWVDAFAARVSQGSHIWNVPGGPPSSQIEIDLIFKEMFSPSIFTHLAKNKTALTLSGNDLFTQENLVKKRLQDSALAQDVQRNKKAVVITDENGFYLGDWRNIDVEGVSQIIMLLGHCLRWLENYIHLNLISLFAKKGLHTDEVLAFLQEIFEKKIRECAPVDEYTEEQKSLLDEFLKKVFDLKEGLESNFNQFGTSVANLKILSQQNLEEVKETVRAAQIFDGKGNVVEDRPKLFGYLKKFIEGLQGAIQSIRSYLEKIDVALQIKMQVLGFTPQFVTVRADVEEMRSKMSGHQYLTVTYPDAGKFYPVGVVRDEDLRKKVLGTVSLRDFSNRDEMTIPSYLEVISIIDHHKSSLNTYSPTSAIISDAQSSNSLVAELAFQINDGYSLHGMQAEQLEADLAQAKDFSPRLFQRLLKAKHAAKTAGNFYVHIEREIAEYLHFLYGILDDTDLLMKVSTRDIDCVVELLNRLKSLIAGKQLEIINCDDLAKDEHFAKKAAERILQNEDMYSIYKKVYEYREKEIEKNIELAAKKQPSTLFSDTKEINACCRVGQTKMFVRNRPAYEQLSTKLQEDWYARSEKIHADNPEIDLYLHMISTIVGADEVYKGKNGHHYQHKDELWIWAAHTEVGVEHLKRFLNAFKASAEIIDNDLEVDFLGDNTKELELVFKESFIGDIPMHSKDCGIPIAVLKYKAGSINSRKAMISPYLPALSS